MTRRGKNASTTVKIPDLKDTAQEAPILTAR